MKIPVTFRIDRVATEPVRDVFAVFTDRATHPTNKLSERVCYAHIGQHGECSLAYCQLQTRAATPEEYADLLRELEQIYNVDGDTLDVRKTRSARVRT